MHLKEVTEAWKKLSAKMNEKGIPIPLVRDPSTKSGSVPLTLVILSSVLVAVGIVGKWSKHLDGIDMASAMQFFYTSCSLYFGHSWVHKETIGADGKTQDLDIKTGDTNQN